VLVRSPEARVRTAGVSFLGLEPAPTGTHAIPCFHASFLRLTGQTGETPEIRYRGVAIGNSFVDETITVKQQHGTTPEHEENCSVAEETLEEGIVHTFPFNFVLAKGLPPSWHNHISYKLIPFVTLLPGSFHIALRR
jgi:hypothetical protein